MFLEFRKGFGLRTLKTFLCRHYFRAFDTDMSVLRGASRRALLYFREISVKYGRSGARARYRSRIALKYSGALLNPKPETYKTY